MSTELAVELFPRWSQSWILLPNSRTDTRHHSDKRENLLSPTFLNFSTQSLSPHCSNQPALGRFLAACHFLASLTTIFSCLADNLFFLWKTSCFALFIWNNALTHFDRLLITTVYTFWLWVPDLFIARSALKYQLSQFHALFLYMES